MGRRWRSRRPARAAISGHVRPVATGRGAACGQGVARTDRTGAPGRTHQTAVRLGERPNRREIELLAKRGRLQLDEQVDAGPRPDESASPAASLGLTRREAEVLTLLAAGRTNRPRTVHHREVCQRPRLPHSCQTERGRPRRGGRDRPPHRPSQAMISPPPGPSSLCSGGHGGGAIGEGGSSSGDPAARP
jgi:hypothetical protein